MKYPVTALLAALSFGSLVTFASIHSAQAQNIAQTAPKNPTLKPSIRSAPPQVQRSANAYFESRTQTRSPQQRRMGGWRLDAHQRGMARDLNRRSASTGQRSPVARPNGGTVVSSERLSPSTRANPRRSARREPERHGDRHRNRGRSGGVIDARLPWAARESSGVRFGVVPDPRPIPRTRALDAPQVPYFSPGPATRLSQLPERSRLHHYRGRDWYAIEGRWFQRDRQNGYVSVIPAVGFVTPFLPDGTVEIEIDDVIYYRSRGVSYRAMGDEYMVVESVASSSAAGGYRERESLQPLFYSSVSDLYAEPTQGQTESDFEADAGRCVARAEADTDFDPSEPASDRLHPSEAEQFNDFQAMSRACLELAGYDIY